MNIAETAATDDLLMGAWGVIANAYGGDWNAADPGWKEAAEAWRDKWHGYIDRADADVIAQAAADWREAFIGHGFTRPEAVALVRSMLTNN